MGKGGFGEVRRAKLRETQKEIALKIIRKDKMPVSHLELFRHEIETLKLCQHPNIIQFYDVLEDANNLYISMEYLKGGDLAGYIKAKNGIIEEKRTAQIVGSLAKALVYMHKIGIIHRDLKPENILFVDRGESSDVKVVDLGLALLVGTKEKCTDTAGTLSYAAPEVLLGLPYSNEVDMWGLGMITYLLFSGNLPFHALRQNNERRLY